MKSETWLEPKNHGKFKSRKSSYKQTSMTLGASHNFFQGCNSDKKGGCLHVKSLGFCSKFLPRRLFSVKSKA